ncbi:MAG: RsmB/NOP family class I SAM-dependent RNA methyltransferase [Muribaculaceae bacterium]|nr:RsmB/NOP family class I SAM-dependent RNA methyltransferase [Muribaculaceae bacterium]
MPQSLPEEFVELIHNSDIPFTAGLPEALASGCPVVSIRTNPAKRSGAQIHCDAAVPWCRDGVYLDERPTFTFDPAFHQGAYYVQEASSMLIDTVIRQLTAGMQPCICLDACAAPGGKTTAAISALPEGSLMVANEFVPQRASVLRDNLIKWGYPGIVVSRGDTAAISRLRNTFDIILADVPCSGEGMMRKDEEAVRQWSPALVHQCAELQWEIVQNIWPALKPGGYLVYSTCTFNTTENDGNVQRIIDELGAEPVTIDIDESWGIVYHHHCMRMMPHRLRGEGLTMAVLRKPGELRHTRIKDTKAGKPVAPAARKMVAATPATDLIAEGDSITAFPHTWMPVLAELRRRLNVIYAGTEVATIKGKDIIPAHALAMSTIINRQEFAETEVDRNTAISYLRRDAIELPEDTPRGYVLLTYNGQPLGFVKNLGTRSNNLYPQSLRILSTHAN